jgi:2-polyprenyl-3-methyl-5-hydroxy-6-metoxy-1,4-benzoquinol methylase
MTAVEITTDSQPTDSQPADAQPTDSQPPDATAEADAAEALAGRLFEAGLAAIELATIDLGCRLGLYQALSTDGALSVPELAVVAGIDPRYAREWLEQQAACGLLAVDRVDAGPDERRYELPAGSAEVLLDPHSLTYVRPMAELPAVLGRVSGQLEHAYRTGGGVPYADYGFHEVQAAFNRPVFENLLAAEWLPAISDVEAMLHAGATVAELGCGEGWAAIALAEAYPSISVHGYDLDDASIAAARRHAAEAGLAERVSFDVADVTDVADARLDAAVDVVFCFEMVHDLARPVEALRTARRLVGDRGPVIVMDERVGETFTAPADPVEQFLYGASVLHCLPVGMASQPSAGVGTVMRPEVFRGFAADAGFGRCEVLDIDHPMFRFYRLDD